MKMYIKDLGNFVGQEIKEPFLLKGVYYNENRFSNRWQDLIIEDVTGSAQIKSWAENMDMNVDNYLDTVVIVTGKVDMYKSKPGIIVAAIEPCEKYQLSDFIYMLSAEKKAELIEKLNGFVELISDKKLKALVNNVFNKKILGALASLPAGSLSHQYCGALLVHTLEVVGIANSLLDVFNRLEDGKPYTTAVNKDLIIAGSLLHDVGKFSSFSNFPSMKKTSRGLKLSSRVESISIIEAYLSQFKKDEKYSNMVDLKHVILSTEEDAKPISLEAIIVANANRTSKEIDAYSTAFYKHDKAHPYSKDNLAYSKLLGYSVLREGGESSC